MVHRQDGSVLYACTKFEADISIRSKVIRGSHKFQIESRHHVTLSHPLLSLKRKICVEIHLRILTAKFYASILIGC